jgi:hypothetical protein
MGTNEDLAERAIDRQWDRAWSRQGCACWRPETEPAWRRLVVLWRTRCPHAAFWKGVVAGALLFGWGMASAALHFYRR